MKYLFTFLGIAAAALIILGIWLYGRRRKKNAASDRHLPQKAEQNAVAPLFEIETLLPETMPDENRLTPVTDDSVLAQINHLVFGTAKTAHSVVETVRSVKDPLYKVVIPKDAKLVDSKAMRGAKRAMFMNPDGGIGGHANLVPADAKKAVAGSAVSSAMNVASMVVGQYYMTEINAELGKISDSISQVIDFQDSEYRGRVLALMTQTSAMAYFQAEILENDELRTAKIAQLDRLEETCVELLNQANVTLTGYTQKNDLDFAAYEKTLKEAQKWCTYQQSLQNILEQIAALRHTFYMGTVSLAFCAAQLPTYQKQTAETRERLAAWHGETLQRLRIDTEAGRRQRTGADAWLFAIPGHFKSDLNFRTVDQSTLDLIATQSTVQNETPEPDKPDLYAEDVQLFIKEGKVYYLPEVNAK